MHRTARLGVDMQKTEVPISVVLLPVVKPANDQLE